MSKQRKTSRRRAKRTTLPKLSTQQEEESSKLSQSKGKLTPNLKLFYTKLGLGVIAGVIAGVLEFTGTRGLFFGFIVILTSYWIVRYIIGVTEEEIETSKIFLKGTISFFFMFTVVWTIVFQLVHGYPYELDYNFIIKYFLTF